MSIRPGAPPPARSPASFEAFYETSYPLVLRSVVGALGGLSEAEDCVADAFVKAFERWPVVSGHPAPRAWVTLTAINVSRDRARRMRLFHRLAPRIAAADVRPEPDLPVDPVLLAALRALPEKRRDVVVLRVLLELSCAQTADALGLTPAAVATHLHRGLSSLRSVLVPTEPEVSR